MYRTYEQAKLAVSGITFTGHPNAKFKSVSDFARKARYWSEARFRREIANLRRNQRVRRRYNELVSRGASAKAARKASQNRQSYEGILESLRRAPEFFADDFTSPKERRKEKWAKWGERNPETGKSKYPKWIRNIVTRINVEAGYGSYDSESQREIADSAHYGWVVQYYVYVYDLDEEFVKNYITVQDRFGDFYRDLVKELVT